jgi:NADPH2:quinone reductase
MNRMPSEYSSKPIWCVFCPMPSASRKARRSIVPYGTAFRALFQRARAQAGETVLVHGGSGGVGIAAIQMAKAHGLTVARRRDLQRDCNSLKNRAPNTSSTTPTRSMFRMRWAPRAGAAFDVILEMAAHINLGTIWICWHPMDVSWLSAAGAKSRSTRATHGERIGDSGYALLQHAARRTSRNLRWHRRRLADGSLTRHGAEFPSGGCAARHEAVMQPGARGKIVLIP